MRLAPLFALVPFLFAGAASADDPPKPTAPTETGGSPKDPGETEKPAADGIEWSHDYEAAKDKAATEKKGLFVYLTPAWFT
jgi:hypothetical protein